MFSFINKKSCMRLKFWGGLEENFQNGGLPFFSREQLADVLLLVLELGMSWPCYFCHIVCSSIFLIWASRSSRIHVIYSSLKCGIYKPREVKNHHCALVSLSDFSPPSVYKFHTLNRTINKLYMYHMTTRHGHAINSINHWWFTDFYAT